MAPAIPIRDGPPASDLALSILQELSTKDSLLSIVDLADVPSQTVKAAVDRLASRSMIVYEQIDSQEPKLEPEAEAIVAQGSHEVRVFEAVRNAPGGLAVPAIEKALGDATYAKVGMGIAFRQKWVKKQGDTIVLVADSIPADSTREQLESIKSRTYDPQILPALKKRKLLTLQKVVSFRITKGPKFALAIPEEETDLTTDLLQSGRWQSVTFKKYNFNALGARQSHGAFHPLMKMREEFRQIFLQLGFEEMPSNQFVESGFWNFDTLFVPQQHPARDMQDTFYLEDPVKALRPGIGSPHLGPGEYYQQYFDNIKEVHQDGKFGSTGYRYPWSEDECLKLVLRTHTTAISTAMLHKLATETGGGRTARYFSIDRVFRNESVDATHLCEFHQVEGVIADYGLTLGGLMEFLTTFFEKMNVTNLQFKPAYNPYTEPSLEIFSYHPGLGKIIEIGNSGLFRPEMLEAMGLDKNLRVYGFGLGLERPTMLKYGLTNIRELLGHQVDITSIQNNPAVRLDRD
ncbi:putative phenylalanyl-tRNA synthetase alpha chain [Rosellinia necatrix]|uniref:phenylalanine--tRNA ligase n=1 Tax=Rosellinia necatrix TaxID=77044 RepID=A0A1W2THC7_ROSNE|nr:putative phenylalanyl-tRNA synthetase alpha chain [Rosellinia necatrix]